MKLFQKTEAASLMKCLSAEKHMVFIGESKNSLIFEIRIIVIIDNNYFGMLKKHVKVEKKVR